MPRFYLDLSEGGQRFDGEEGIEVTDSEAARFAAIVGLRDVTCGAIRNGELDLGCYIAVEDETGQEVDRVFFSHALHLTNKAI